MKTITISDPFGYATVRANDPAVLSAYEKVERALDTCADECESECLLNACNAIAYDEYDDAQEYRALLDILARYDLTEQDAQAWGAVDDDEF